MRKQSDRVHTTCATTDLREPHPRRKGHETTMSYNPDDFRVAVGRFKERWYHDPLPSCAIAEQSDWQGPSISTVKKASGQDWSFVTLKRIAELPPATLQQLANYNLSDRHNELRQLSQTALRIAAGRGSIVHLWAETMLLEGTMRELTEQDVFNMGLPVQALDEALKYRSALQTWFDTNQPELLACEAVVLNRDINSYGYGGTIDAWVKLNGEVTALDWKTRTPSSRHGAYPEEAAQIAAGIRGNYWMEPVNGSVQRSPIPNITRGTVISIKPEGCREYDIDINNAWTHFQNMHNWWTARRTENDAIYKTPKLGTKPVDTTQRDNLVERIHAIRKQGHAQQLAEQWRPDLPKPSLAHTWTEQQRATITHIVENVEREHELDFTDHTPMKPVRKYNNTKHVIEKPDDTQPADPTAINKIKELYSRLDDEQIAFVKSCAMRANQRGYSINIQQNPSVRRFDIASAIIKWSEINDQEMFMYALNTVNPRDSESEQIGLLTSEQATELHAIARHILNGKPVEITINKCIKLGETQ